MTRDPRLDVFRGLALVIILIDHLPGNFWSDYTLGKAGFSDAAEGFVLISGISAGLAYGDYFRQPGQMMAGVGRIARRMRTIYLVQLLITALAIATALVLARVLDTPGMLEINQLPAMLADPWAATLRVLVLGQHLDYVDILPVYFALLAATPAMLWLAWRSPLALLTLSVVLWALANRYDLNLPNHPAPNGWFFNPLTWQVYFVIGLLTGTALKDGRRLVPISLWLLIPACAILAFGVFLFLGQPWSDPIWDWRWAMQQADVPPVFLGLEKTFVPLPRLIHALALAYVLSCFAVVRRACASDVAAPFAVLGRNALPVFAMICVLNFAMQLIRVKLGMLFTWDTVMLVGALGMVLALAAGLQHWRKPG
jgi:hypothetical protein